MKFLSTLMAVIGVSLPLFGATMTMESGKYRILFHDMPHRWSIIHFYYDGIEIGPRTGYYGNVMCPASGKYIGAGHTEGGTEKFLEGTVSVDGGEAVPVGEGVFKGDKVVFKKSSTLANIKLNCTYTLTADGLKIDKQFTALADQPMHQFYLWQFCWTKNTTDYLFIRRDGSVEKGKFLNDNKNRVYGEKEAYFFSQYWPEKQVGFVNFFAEFGKFSGKNLLWDVGRAYHKYYFWIDLPKVVKAGYSSPEMTMIVKAFTADSEAQWEEKSKDTAAELLKQYPFAARPINTEEGVTLEPSKVFQVKKYGLDVYPDGQYNISFEIRKTPGMSARPTDHYVLVGYYDNNKPAKFHVLTSMASKVKDDGEFHQVQGAFKTPATREKIFVYVYNSRSTGFVTVRNLKVEKL